MNKIAIASIGNEYVDQHFGNAKYWQIYEKIGEEYIFLEQRLTSSYCKGSCEGGFEHIISKLNDCDGIFVAKIGEQAAAVMLEKGKRVFTCNMAAVEDLIEELRENDDY
ncbi:MAG: diguanylate cyclase [Ruminococcus sp.]|jgi:predicted Fe-Mo cluster-binding NifX family protein|nr:diguanylate cyclase [Ruminococcus sp.]